MENGGRGEHRPWKYADELLNTYHYYAKLHHELVPYLYSTGVEAHQTGQPIIRDTDRQHRQYRLGPDLLVAPIVSDEDGRDVSLPAGVRWYDYWNDDQVFDGPALVHQDTSPDRIPLYIRGGSIIPLQVADGETGHGDAGSAGHLTLLVYPDDDSTRIYHPDSDRSVTFRSHRDPSGVSLGIEPQTERYVLRIKQPTPPTTVALERDSARSTPPPLPTWQAFDQADEGWYYDPARHYLWVRFSTEATGARLSYAMTAR